MQDERTPDPDIERLRELAAETQSAAARILAERNHYREVLAVIASGDWVEDNPLVMRDFAREALKAGKR